MKKMKKTLTMLLILSLLCALLAGCGGKAPETTAEPETAAAGAEAAAEQPKTPRTVVDMAGNEVQLPDTVDRVFCDWASGVTLIMTLGATEKLVDVYPAIDTDTFAWARAICPAIAEVNKDDAPFSNPEAILNYEPDLVVTNTKDNIEAYTNLGLTTVYVEYNSNDSFKESMLIVGTALGEKEQAAAEKYNAYFDANVAMVRQRLADVAEADKPSVYYMDSRFGDAYHTVGTGEIQEDWITTAGGVLATAQDFEGRNLEITAEKFLEIDPDVILIGAQKQAEVYDLLQEDSVLAGLSALENGAVYRIPQGIFPWCRTGPEAAMQMVWAGKLLYPERFEDIDMADFAKTFYREFYGSEVSDDTIAGILAGKLCPDAA